jgi:hypothetical protein
VRATVINNAALPHRPLTSRVRPYLPLLAIILLAIPSSALQNADLSFADHSCDELSLSINPKPATRFHLPLWQDVSTTRLPHSRPFSGIPIASRLPEPVRFSAPLDLAIQYRVPIELCPDYWPEHQPGKTLAQFCEDEYYNYWPLDQAGDHNPFAIARDQIKALNRDPAMAKRRILAALAHWYINGRTAEAAASTLLGALATENKLRNDIAFELATDFLLELAPESLSQVVPDPDTLAADLHVTSSFSYDTAVSMSRMLRIADRRGLNAVVVADHGHIGGAQEAIRIAEDLKRHGLISQDFVVISGQRVTCLGGTMTAVGLKSRVPEGMTFDRTIREIHSQGAVAILNHPGQLGALDLLQELDVDAYFIQPTLFELFRTMNVLYDPELAEKPALYASHTRYAQGVGLPYSAIISSTPDVASAVAALRNGEAYAASNLYFPLMALLTFKPIAAFERTLNSYFVGHDWLTHKTRALLAADCVIITTTWDESIRDLMSLDDTLKEIRQLSRGQSPLCHAPKLSRIAAQYGFIQIEYQRYSKEIWLRGRLSF